MRPARPHVETTQPGSFTWPQVGLTVNASGQGPEGTRGLLLEALWIARASNAMSRATALEPLGARDLQVLIVLRLWDGHTLNAKTIAGILLDKRPNVDRSLRVLEAEELVDVEHLGHKTRPRRINDRGRDYVDTNIGVLRAAGEWQDPRHRHVLDLTGKTSYREVRPSRFLPLAALDEVRPRSGR